MAPVLCVQVEEKGKVIEIHVARVVRVSNIKLSMQYRNLPS